MPSARYDVIRRSASRFAPDVFGSGTEHSDWHEWWSTTFGRRISASERLFGTTERAPARRNDTASRDSVADGMAIRLRYGEGRIDLGWSSPLRLAPPLISARRSCHPKQ
jgi:hypothetical protein